MIVHWHEVGHTKTLHAFAHDGITARRLPSDRGLVLPKPRDKARSLCGRSHPTNDYEHMRGMTSSMKDWLIADYAGPSYCRECFALVVESKAY